MEFTTDRFTDGPLTSSPQALSPGEAVDTVAAADALVVGGHTWGLYSAGSTPSNPFGSHAVDAWAAGRTGSTKVAVGVIDTGVDYTHQDLYLNIWLNAREIPTAIRSVLKDTDNDGLITLRDLNASVNAAHVRDVNANGRIDAGDLLNDARWENGIDEDGNGYIDDLIGWNFQANNNDPMDDQGHGTHVAGTIGAMGGNGLGVAGVAWTVQMVTLKTLGPNGGVTTDAIRAVDYFTNASRVSTGLDFVATNNSWGGAGFSQGLSDAIARAAAADILFVAAAGNGGADKIGDNNDVTPHFPANYTTAARAGYDAVVSVASINSTGGLSTFSNFGSASVDLGAPGQSIASTLRGGGYGFMSGTSMAAPHVTGAIALYSAVNPSASAAQIRQDLLASTIATDSLAGKTVTGGRLDVAGFVARAAEGRPANVTGTAGGDLITPTAGVIGQPLPGRGADTLSGMGGADTLDGGEGADRLVGGSGNDVYIVDNAGDLVVELAGEGLDQVRSSVSYALPANVENLILTGGSATSGHGNALDNVLVGNAAANLLTGGAGNDTLDGGAGGDTLQGGDGADSLTGGAGADRMEGGAGSDVYVVDHAGDVVLEAGGAAGGVDLVRASVSFVLPVHVENLVLTGDAANTGSGNELGNSIQGNAAANRLLGLSGNDTLNGGGGGDTLEGGAGADRLIGGDGADRFVFVRGEISGDAIQDFAPGDLIQLRGYAPGSRIVAASGSTTDWIVTDAVSGTSETLRLLNGYKLGAGDFLFG